MKILKVFPTALAVIILICSCSNGTSQSNNDPDHEGIDLTSEKSDDDLLTDNESCDEDIAVDRIVVDYSTNTYILTCGEHAVVVDPGSKPETIEMVLEDRTVDYLLLTHGHFDHIMGLDRLKETYPFAKIAIHEDDQEFLYDTSLNMSTHFIQVDYIFSGKVDFTFTEDDTIKFCGKDIGIIHLPGHTPGSSAFHFDNNVLVGDTLMYMKIGVLDLPHSDKDQLIKSIKEKLFTLDDETVVYPGHGKSTTIGFEKENNPDLQEQSETPSQITVGY